MPHRRGIHIASLLNYDSCLVHAIIKFPIPLVIHSGMCKTMTRKRPLPKKAIAPDCQASIIFAADVLDLVLGDSGEHVWRCCREQKRRGLSPIARVESYNIPKFLIAGSIRKTHSQRRLTSRKCRNTTVVSYFLGCFAWNCLSGIRSIPRPGIPRPMKQDMIRTTTMSLRSCRQMLSDVSIDWAALH